MKTSTKDQAGGKMEEGKGKLKKRTEKVTENTELEDERMDKDFGAKVRDTIGKFDRGAGI